MGTAVQEASRNIGGDFHQRDPRRPDRRRGASDRRLRTCVIQAFAIGKKWPPHLFYLPVVRTYRASGRDLPRPRTGSCSGAVFPLANATGICTVHNETTAYYTTYD